MRPFVRYLMAAANLTAARPQEVSSLGLMDILNSGLYCAASGPAGKKAGGDDEEDSRAFHRYILVLSADYMQTITRQTSRNAILMSALGHKRTSRSYSITSSAISRKSRGIVRPSALAVFRLITSSNFAGCCTGNSAGFAPFRIFAK